MRLVLVAEEPDGLLGHVHGTPEIHLEYVPCDVIRSRLRFPEGGETGIVEDDVDASELGLGGGEGVDDLLRLGDVQLDSQQAVGGILGGEVG